MPRLRLAIKQRTMGGALGIAVLIFALGYYFVPESWKGTLQQTSENAHAQQDGTNENSMTIGFEERPQSSKPAPPRTHVVAMGPPLALATDEALQRYTQDKMAAAILAALEPDDEHRDDPAQAAQLLAQADAHMAQDDLAGAADSALALYREALMFDRDNRAAARGIARIHMQLLQRIERAVDAGDKAAAQTYVTQLADVPGAAADVTDWQRILSNFDEVQPLLEKAQAQMQAQHFLPTDDAEDNAADLYQQVLTIDAHNETALTALRTIQNHILEQALAEAHAGNYKPADTLIEQATDILPGAGQLQDVRARIEGIRGAQAKKLVQDARAAMAANDLPLARSLRDQAQRARPDVGGLTQLDRDLAQYERYGGHRLGDVYRSRFIDTRDEGPSMVVIPSGSFMMGTRADDPGSQAHERPQHKITFQRAFAIARHEVTVGEFRQFITATDYVPDSISLAGSSVYDENTGTMRQQRHATWQHDYAGRRAGDDMPVVNVSWNDAKAYAKWLEEVTGKTYDLPSEAQFAYALNAGSSGTYWWGSHSPREKVENLTGDQDRSSGGRRWNNAFQNYGDGYWGPAPVASFKANPFGLYDMGGNVSEWVRDCWHDTYRRAPTDGSAWENPGCQRRVLRGGSWGSSPQQSRSAWRQGAGNTERGGRVGFRVVEEFH